MQFRRNGVVVVKHGGLWRGVLDPVWHSPKATLRPRTTSGWRGFGRQAPSLLICGLSLNTTRIARPGFDWVGITQSFELIAICLAIASIVWRMMEARMPSNESGKRTLGQTVVPSLFLAGLAVGLMWLVVIAYTVVDLRDLPHHDPQQLDWLALATTCTALVIQLWSPFGRFALIGLYTTGLMLDGMLLVQRDLSPGRFFIWTGTCELTGFLLAAALLGWSWQRFRLIATVLKVPGGTKRWGGKWFCWSQAVLAAVAVLLIAWILLDPSLDAMGEGRALLGLSGHWASCPAALMLLGMTIVMAWQTRDRWRGGWQYAALGAGILFTTSIGWARIDGASPDAWPQRIVDLLVSASMMTLLTRFGLARVLPWSGDWITRARRAAPVFGSAALLLAIVALIQWAVG